MARSTSIHPSALRDNSAAPRRVRVCTQCNLRFSGVERRVTFQKPAGTRSRMGFVRPSSNIISFCLLGPMTGGGWQVFALSEQQPSWSCQFHPHPAGHRGPPRQVAPPKLQARRRARHRVVLSARLPGSHADDRPTDDISSHNPTPRPSHPRATVDSENVSEAVRAEHEASRTPTRRTPSSFSAVPSITYVQPGSASRDGMGKRGCPARSPLLTPHLQLPQHHCHILQSTARTRRRRTCMQRPAKQ